MILIIGLKVVLVQQLMRYWLVLASKVVMGTFADLFTLLEGFTKDFFLFETKFSFDGQFHFSNSDNNRI